MQGNLSVAFEALAMMPAIVNVDFTNNIRLVGSWLGNTTYSTQVVISRVLCRAPGLQGRDKVRFCQGSIRDRLRRAVLRAIRNGVPPHVSDAV